MEPEKIVLELIADVLNGHNGDRAGGYFTEDMTWHGGTVGTVTGRDAVAGLMTMVVTAIPDLHAELQDIVVQGDKVDRPSSRERDTEGRPDRDSRIR